MNAAPPPSHLPVDRKTQFSRLLKYIGMAVATTLAVAMIAPSEFKTAIISLNLTILVSGFLLRSWYIFAPLPHQERFKSGCEKTVDIYQSLTIEQKLYVNAVVLTLVSAMIYFIGGKILGQPMAIMLLLFYGFIAFRDVMRWYRTLSENLLGKAFIALGFAIATNLAYALANQLVSQVVNVTPTNFVRTTLFIAILTIPVLMTFAGSIVFTLGTALSSLFVLFSMGADLNGFRRWLFAGTWPELTLRFAFVTRLFQFVFYLSIVSTISIFGARHFSWYEKKILDWIPSMIYTLDMYAANECKLGKEYKIAPLGDAKFLIAQKSVSGLTFKSPAKCDDLPSAEAVVSPQP